MDSIRTENERKVNNRDLAGHAPEIPKKFLSKHPRAPTNLPIEIPHFAHLLTLYSPNVADYEEILRNAAHYLLTLFASIDHISLYHFKAQVLIGSHSRCVIAFNIEFD